MSQHELLQTRTVTHAETSKRTSTATDTTASVQRTTYKKKKPVGKMVLFGAVSAAAYVLLFTNETLITKTFTLGGWYAACPVLTAFFFSFIHGAFASNLLSVLGLEAKK